MGQDRTWELRLGWHRPTAARVPFDPSSPFLTHCGYSVRALAVRVLDLVTRVCGLRGTYCQARGVWSDARRAPGAPFMPVMHTYTNVAYGPSWS